MGKNAWCSTLTQFKGFFLISSLVLFSISLATAQVPHRLSNDFVTLYPGVYTEREKALIDQYIADINALEARDEIDIKKLIDGKLPEDTPGVGPTLKVTEAMVRYNNEKYDPENRVLNDAKYAKSLGYRDIIAYPTFSAYDDFFLLSYPSETRDTYLCTDLNHSITNYGPVYPGDTLYLVLNSGLFTDLTPAEGFIYRSIAVQFNGSIYNQKGEKVSDVIFRSTRHIKIYKEGKAPENPGPRAYWEAPDWMNRPVHYYTDGDWEYIRDLWSKEKRQGAEPLYWEDVNIGDEPAWTVDGPILESVRPTPVYGMGTGGSRTMKMEIMNPEIFKTMIRSEVDGIYLLPDREDYIPPVPNGSRRERPTTAAESNTIDTADIHRQTEDRAVLINYIGRDLALRHIHNWMGDHGWVYNIRWSIMAPTAHAANGQIVPANHPQGERFLEKVPKMKGKYVMAHGLTGDLAIVRSYVYDKYFRNGDFFIDLVWWVETIDGYIWEEGGVTVELPSKRVQ